MATLVTASTRLGCPVVMAALALSACDGISQEIAPPITAPAEVPSARAAAGEPRLCAAVAGNGPNILVHWTALARVVENHGLIDAIAGGSSASVTSFLVESIALNPLVTDCAGTACSETQQRQRVALLLKSLEGYMGVLAGTEEAAAVQTLAPLARSLRAEGERVHTLADVEAGRAAIERLLDSPALRRLANPELLGLLRSSPDLAYHVQDTAVGLRNLGAFVADSERIFLRPSVIQFTAAAELIGRAGDFYAGYGPLADSPQIRALYQQFLDGCAGPARGQAWAQIAALDAGGTTCGALFTDLLGRYRAALSAREASGQPGRSRIDDPVGTGMHTLVSSSVLTGAAARTVETALASYRAARDYGFDVDFAEVRFGYWGRAEDLARIVANPQGFADLRTRKLMALGPGSWREALSRSPAEPGLSPAQRMADGNYTAGGWVDLVPSLVLRNLGCDKVVLLTRPDGIGPYVGGIARMLGAGDDFGALYDLASPASSDATAVAAADATICLDWDHTARERLFELGRTAPLESADPFFLGAGDPHAVDTSRPGTGTWGCSPHARAP